MPSPSKKPTKSKDDITTSNASESDNPKALLENLYKQNVELVVKNKTLSLLSKLYEISILTLKPKELAMRVTQTIQVDLGYELVGIFIFESKTDSLVSLGLSKSERAIKSLGKFGVFLDDVEIPDISTRDYFKKAIYSKEENMTNNFEKIWSDLIDPVQLRIVASESHIKTSLLYPLIIENNVLGVIMLALNHNYETLNSFEKESIKSFVNLVALALEKTFLYQKLENANAKLREIDRQKDAVLHMVAHQFKGPVTTINFTTELLLDGSYGELTPEQKENVTTIRTASQKMGAQSEMVLDAAKITLGKLPLSPSSVDLNVLFKEVVEEAQNHAKQMKVNMKVNLPNQPLPTATLDRKYTQLAIDNLLGNAVKYTAMKSEGGNVEFAVSMKDKTLFCSVKDTGIGIPKAEQENIFKELYRASNAGKDGNGLGLRVARGAIEAQGGKMWFESEEGKGTTFFVELPVHQ